MYLFSSSSDVIGSNIADINSGNNIIEKIETCFERKEKAQVKIEEIRTYGEEMKKLYKNEQKSLKSINNEIVNSFRKIENIIKEKINQRVEKYSNYQKTELDKEVKNFNKLLTQKDTIALNLNSYEKEINEILPKKILEKKELGALVKMKCENIILMNENSFIFNFIHRFIKLPKFF